MSAKLATSAAIPSLNRTSVVAAELVQSVQSIRPNDRNPAVGDVLEGAENMAMDTETQQEFTFQAEIKQLLHLLAHSLYQSREIAVRELISNASDALDKMRYVSLTDESQRDVGPFEIELEGRPDARELVLRDNGIGMTRDELVTNLGTIARSGSLEFLKSAVERATESKPDLALIGQFGVGFYSAFMIADRVRVRTRSYREEAGWEWESEGTGTFSVRPAEGLSRGTEIVLHLKEDAANFATNNVIEGIIKRYSSFIPYPIKIGSRVINDQKPIWVEPKSQVTEEQYNQFYQHLTHHMGEEPLWHLHLAADSPIQFRAVLYCPPTNLERLGLGRLEHGLNLCAKRVLVQHDCRDLVPDYLRFLCGLVDSEDLPLNISRETLQDNTVIRRIRGTIVKGVLDRLHQLAEEKPAAFRTFSDQFGMILKEGVLADPPQRERIAKLLRFASTRLEGDARTSLEEYIQRAPADQKPIYYLGGPDLATVLKSPSLEIFRRRRLEVLLLTEPIDEFVLATLGTFADHPLESIDAADLELPPEPEEEKKAEGENKPPAGLSRVLDLFRQALGDRVQEVRESHRLTDSPCCLVNADGALTTQMQRILRQVNRDVPKQRRILEINPASPLVQRLASLSSNTDHDGFIRHCGEQLWANALLLEGSLDEPQALVTRVQEFMEEAARARSPIVF